MSKYSQQVTWLSEGAGGQKEKEAYGGRFPRAGEPDVQEPAHTASLNTQSAQGPRSTAPPNTTHLQTQPLPPGSAREQTH